MQLQYVHVYLLLLPVVHLPKLSISTLTLEFIAKTVVMVVATTRCSGRCTGADGSRDDGRELIEVNRSSDDGGIDDIIIVIGALVGLFFEFWLLGRRSM